ncbi:MAG: RNA polymerase subunit sigma-70 [Haliea sp.]|nr:RNA polymerase subunit sigma-70 [Haliea sp.]MBK40593.1 RNA polymerase subunit sigma-70 [Haliea sp.]MBP68692.1 RNA polymerase subunit sigma-70 [Haliea sp.]HCD55196.1 RNA polymerase subunit sigma-70 [Halieaceae bacterium]
MSACFLDNCPDFLSNCRGAAYTAQTERSDHVDNWKTETDDRELERLFAEARRYPLLSAEQERDIDASKWRAVDDLGSLFVHSAGGRHFLQDLLARIQHEPPEVANFANRDHHFLLRRELVSYLSGGDEAGAVILLAGALSAGDLETAQETIREMALPASLVVGMAGALARANAQAVKCRVADALHAWQTTTEGRTPATKRYRLESTQLKALSLALSRFNQARDTLTLHNLRLVYSIAGKARGKGAPYRDLIQEGTLGLIRAAEKFEAAKGYRFSTYCYNWISQAVRRYISDSAALIRYPTHVREQVGKLYRERNALWSSSGEEPSEEALASAAGIATDKARELRQLRNMAISLDQPQFDDDDESLLDSMPGGPFDDIDARAESASLQRCLLQEIEHLDPAEKQVVIARWGLHDGPPLTRAEVADKLRVSREWVRQLEKSALDKLSRNSVVRKAASDHGTLSPA